MTITNVSVNPFSDAGKTLNNLGNNIDTLLGDNTRYLQIYTVGDSLETITTPGYLNGWAKSFQFYNSDIAAVSYNPNNTFFGLKTRIFRVYITGEPDELVYSLVEINSY